MAAWIMNVRARTVVVFLVAWLAAGWLMSAGAGELAQLHRQQRPTAKPAVAAPAPLPHPPQGQLQLAPLPRQEPVTDITRIGLERTLCFGTCPAYTLIIWADGSFEYVGEANVERVGEYSGTVPVWYLNQLLLYIETIDFMAMADTYDSGWLDVASSYTMVESSGITKVVLNTGNAAPATVWALERLIDDLLEHGTWN